jgi:phosphoglycolate phosphatase
VGPPLFDTLHAFGVSEAEYPAALEAYRSRADLSDIHDNAVFPGIIGLLRDLRDAGVPLAIATSKPDVRAIRILEHFDLARYFTVIAGATLDQSRSSKADVVAHALSELTAAGVDVSSPVLVGDRGHDVLGAEANGVPTILVEWGYGSPVEAVGAMAVVHSIDQLRKLLLPR